MKIVEVHNRNKEKNRILNEAIKNNSVREGWLYEINNNDYSIFNELIDDGVIVQSGIKTPAHLYIRATNRGIAFMNNGGYRLEVLSTLKQYAKRILFVMTAITTTYTFFKYIMPLVLSLIQSI